MYNLRIWNFQKQHSEVFVLLPLHEDLECTMDLIEIWMRPKRLGLQVTPLNPSYQKNRILRTCCVYLFYFMDFPFGRNHRLCSTAPIWCVANDQSKHGNVTYRFHVHLETKDRWYMIGNSDSGLKRFVPDVRLKSRTWTLKMDVILTKLFCGGMTDLLLFILCTSHRVIFTQPILPACSLM